MELRFYTLTADYKIIVERKECDPSAIRVPRKHAGHAAIYRGYATDVDVFIGYCREASQAIAPELRTLYTLDEALDLLPIARHIDELIQELLCEAAYDRYSIADIVYELEDKHKHRLSYWYNKAAKITCEKIAAYNAAYSKQ